ncbi:hypothetical protein CHUAL_008225 [Chamberlinius hualienensis]
MLDEDGILINDSSINSSVLTLNLNSAVMRDLSSAFVYYQPWLCSVVASILIGLSGVLPLLIIPLDVGAALKHGGAAKTLRLLLSFAVGGLLGDVFLHLLPEAWNHMAQKDGNPRYMTTGLWVLTGVFTFIVVEMLFEKKDENENEKGMKSLVNVDKTLGEKSKAGAKNNKISKCNSNCHTTNGHNLQPGSQRNDKLSSESRDMIGYLNLLANGIDNFTHGLAVAGSFLVSFKVGVLTTFAILIHEIPHEIGDFAILLRAGFNRFEAAKAQMATSVIGIIGAVAALAFGSTKLSERTVWILPFTAGGFLNIALVNVLPDILQERSAKESIKQVACIVAGIGVMGLVTLLCE